MILTEMLERFRIRMALLVKGGLRVEEAERESREPKEMF